MINNKYNPKKIENYVQKFWRKNKTFKVSEDINKNKYYCLSMFPYPSGNLHIGHIRNYTIGDIIARFNRMIGKNVLYPIGWDAFGLPAENAALSNNISPKEWTLNNIKNMKNQLKILGFSFDWSREISTCSKKYYKWDQWFFNILYNKKLAYKAYSEVNWCPNDNTVLSNEQVIDNNKCWRCNCIIKKKFINQWFIKITSYANILFNDLSILKNWPNKVLLMQKNWISKLEWFEIKLKLSEFKYKKLNLYINNINELIYINFLIISSDSDLAKIILDNKIKKNINFNNENLILNTNILVFFKYINKYFEIKITNNKFILYNIFFKRNTLININLYEKHLINNIFCIYNKNIKIKNFNINEKINFRFFLISKLTKKTKFNLNDWCISRQRYWGVPIPIATYNGLIKTIPNKYLPIELPKYESFVKNEINREIYINKKLFLKEKDTFDTFMQSSWYYIRYTSPKSKKMIDSKAANYWLPVDQYIGGIEHATMHLLYIRFYNKLMKDFNFINNIEPIDKLLCQGMILSKSYFYINSSGQKIWVSPKLVKYKIIEGNKVYYYNNNKLTYDGISKMSKSKNNGIDPIDIINKYGSDVLRVFIIFCAPIKSDFLWEDNKIIGISRFLNKVWDLVIKNIDKENNTYNCKDNILNFNDNFLDYINNIISKVTDDIKNKNKFNLSISLLMNLTKKISLLINKNELNNYLIHESLTILIKLLYPFAPHISFVLWEKLKNNNLLDKAEWPSLYKKTEKKILFLILINNKFKDKIYINEDSSEEYIINYIYKNINKNIYIKSECLKKIIFIKNKLINVLIY